MKRWIAIALCAGIALGAPGAALAQTLLPEQTLEHFRTKDVDVLLLELEHYKRSLTTNLQGLAEGTSWLRGVVRSGLQVCENIRQALGEKGVRVAMIEAPAELTAAEAAAMEAAAARSAVFNSTAASGNTAAVRVGGGGGNTAAIAKSNASSSAAPLGAGMGFTLPALVVLTAAQVAECTSRGKTASDCARDIAVTMAGGATLGALLTVIVPASIAAAATPVLTGFSFVLTTGNAVLNLGSLSIETVRGTGAILSERASDADRMAAQDRNARATTPQKMAEIVAAFRSEMTAADAQDEKSGAVLHDLWAAKVALSLSVGRVRNGVEVLAPLNDEVAMAASRCSTPGRDPVGLVVDADRRVKQLSWMADRILDASAQAASLAASCPTAAAARRLYDQAAKDVEAFDQVRGNATADLRDATVFFPVVKTGRAAFAEITAGLEALDSQVEETRQTAARLLKVTGSYRTIRNETRAVRMRLEAGAKALHGAFPDVPAPYIADGLREIDSLRPAAESEFNDDDLRYFAEATDTEVNRVIGLVRNARTTRKTMTQCENIADELPALLENQMRLIQADLVRHVDRANGAFAAAKDVPARVEACATTQAAGDGTMAGRCSGTITASPVQGKPGTPLRLQVQLTGPEAANVTRIIVDNPGCKDSRCRDTASAGQGLFEIWLAFQAAPNAASVDGIISTFRVKFQAFAGATLMCTGQSKELRVLAR